MRKSALALVLLCWTAIFCSANEAVAQSPLEQSCMRSIDAVADSYVFWAETVCPIYADVVDLYVDIGLPDLAERLAGIYEDTVSRVADGKIAAINSIAASCARAGGNVDEAAQAAIDDILLAEEVCVDEIFSGLEQ